MNLNLESSFDFILDLDKSDFGRTYFFGNS